MRKHGPDTLPDMGRMHGASGTERAAGAAMTGEPEATAAIVDNRARRVGDFLRERIAAGANLSIVSAYFTIYAYGALRDALEGTGRVRFLYGEPRGVGAMDPGENDARAFRLNDDGGIALRHLLAQKALARDCAAWIESKVDVRTVRRAGFLHGKLYHVAGGNGASALVGSSNFTHRGLGYGAAPNVELNIEVRGDADRRALLRWFDGLWNDASLTEDVKAEVLAALERLGAAFAPEFVYYKTLFHVFGSWLARRGEREGLIRTSISTTRRSGRPFTSFRRTGATNAINRLLRHNGCIVADSVGLGKTWTALAVVKFFELRKRAGARPLPEEAGGELGPLYVLGRPAQQPLREGPAQLRGAGPYGPEPPRGQGRGDRPRRLQLGRVRSRRHRRIPQLPQRGPRPDGRSRQRRQAQPLQPAAGGGRQGRRADQAADAVRDAGQHEPA